MATQPVEWVLAIYYGPSAHRATYGRLDNTKYTKDFIQLSRKPDFIKTILRLFGAAGSTGSIPITYKWHSGTTSGALVFQSADRPHLKWETRLGAPKAWRMSLAPSETTAETIPGDPGHRDLSGAEKEFALLESRGAGQPYLLAIKLRGETNTLHLRAYLDGAATKYAWAGLDSTPLPIRELVARTSRKSALAWSLFGNGVFFDPTKNHDAWSDAEPLTSHVAEAVDETAAPFGDLGAVSVESDAAAESSDSDPAEIATFRSQIKHRSFAVPDATATVKTRGSAQKAFADAVKKNYGFRCAVTGIRSREFLVASHIVPWSADQSIRLDPSNGICLSLMVDRAFERGYLLIRDDLSIELNWSKINYDQSLRSQLERKRSAEDRVGGRADLS